VINAMPIHQSRRVISISASLIRERVLVPASPLALRVPLDVDSSKGSTLRICGGVWAD
jgi:hypothetical protein